MWLRWPYTFTALVVMAIAAFIYVPFSMRAVDANDDRPVEFASNLKLTFALSLSLASLLSSVLYRFTH